MLAIRVKDVKAFMAKLLSGDAFDLFLVEEVQIRTFNTFTIDGHQNRDFYTAEELEETKGLPYAYSQWKDIQGICFQLIKGKKVPSLMKIILHYKPEEAERLLKEGNGAEYAEVVKAFVVTIKFDDSGLRLMTGTSLYTFLPDKTPDLLWDTAFRRFLEEKEIAFEEG